MRIAMLGVSHLQDILSRLPTVEAVLSRKESLGVRNHYLDSLEKFIELVMIE